MFTPSLMGRIRRWAGRPRPEGSRSPSLPLEDRPPSPAANLPVDVTGADFTGANLDEATFTGAKGFDAVRGLDQASNTDRLVR